MERFLHQIPKWVFALGGIGLGLILIVAFNPPTDRCTVQLEVFSSSQGHYLMDRKNGGVQITAPFRMDLALCRSSGSVGGCSVLFRKVELMSKELKAFENQCQNSLGEIKELGELLEETYKIIVYLAWGLSGPIQPLRRQGPLESSELKVFCDLRRALPKVFSANRLREIDTNLLRSLPRASVPGGLDNIEERSLLSFRCPNY